MSAQTNIAAAKRFAASYKPADDDHPDLASRVVMFNRAVEAEAGTKQTRVQAVHARTLLRFVDHLGLKVPSVPAKKAAAKKSTGS